MRALNEQEAVELGLPDTINGVGYEYEVAICGDYRTYYMHRIVVEPGSGLNFSQTRYPRVCVGRGLNMEELLAFCQRLETGYIPPEYGSDVPTTIID